MLGALLRQVSFKMKVVMLLILVSILSILSLWGGSVMNLGTKKHQEKYFAGIENVDYPGCFAMTELHHGE